jgi:hypothetical protein
MDNCYDGFGWPEACPDLTIQTDEEINACRQPPQVDETVEGGELSWLEVTQISKRDADHSMTRIH